MVIGFANELPDSPVGSFSFNKHTLTRTFRVQTDNYNDGPLVVTAAIGIPRMWGLYTGPVVAGASEPHEFHLYARCKKIDAKRMDKNSLYWIVTCNFETPDPDEQKGDSKRENDGQQDNPLLRYPEVSTHMENFQVPLYFIYDSDGNMKPAMASNRQVYNPPPMKELSRFHLTITRNEDINSAHPATGIAYASSVNSDIFWGQGPGIWRCMNITATKQNHQLSNGSQFPYLKVQYQFVANPLGWVLQILDAGTFYIDSVSGKKLKFIGDDGHPLGTGPLNGNGDKLPPGDTPVFNLFSVYPKLPFSKLNLIQSFPQAS